MQAKIKYVLATLAAVYVAILLFSHRRVVVAQRVDFAAPPSMIFPYLGKPRLWERWTVWSPKNDAGLSYSFGGPPVGVGMWLAWTSDQFGDRKLTIQEYNKPTTMAYDWEGFPGSSPWRGVFNVTAPNFREAVSATVAWQVSADLGFNPISRIRGSVAANRLRGDMQNSLDTLRGQMESEWADKVRQRAESIERFGLALTETAQ